MESRFQLVIVENPHPMTITYVNNHICVCDRLTMYDILDDMRLKPLHPMTGKSVFALTEDGLWTWDPYAEGDGRQAAFHDIFKSGNTFSGFRGIDGGGQVAEGFYIVDDYETGGESCLTSVEMATKQLYRYKGKTFSTSSVAVSGDVFARGPKRPTDSLFCFDRYIEKKWGIDLPQEANSGVFGDMLEYFRPIVSGGNVIINTGMKDLGDRKEGKVHAFAAVNGSPAWEYTLRALPFSFYAVDDKYYLSLAGDVVVLDTRSGKILLDAPSGFDDRVLVYPYMDALLCFSHDEGRLRVFDKEAKTVLQELEIPGGYSPSMVHQVVSDGRRLFITGSRARTDFVSTSHAVMVVRPHDGKGPIAEIEPRVEMKVTRNNENGEKIYLITTSHDDLDEVLRFGEIWIRETVYTYGFERSVHRDHRDKEHHGKIVFKVDAAKLPPDSMKKINAMTKRLEETFVKLAVYPGVGDKHKFRIVVREK